ncbi:MAG: AMP-binding protein [Labilithrix sp.]|nr:AMP-binding protein [Labilithrix sp.]
MFTFNDVIARLDRDEAGITFLSATSSVPAFVSYRALGSMVRGNVEHLTSLGIRRRDRVAVALETDLEHVVIVLALMAMGAIPVSLKPRRGSIEEHARYVDALVRRFDVRWAHWPLPACAGLRSFGWSDGARSDDASVIAEVEPEDVAFVQFSSGSLGDPKAVPIRHESLLANVRAILELDDRTPGSIGYDFLPLSHDMGLVGGLLSNLVLQNPLYLSPVQDFLKRPARFFTHVPRFRKVICPMPDFALRYLARYLEAKGQALDPHLLSCLDTVYCGAEPIRYSTIASLLKLAPRVGFDPTSLVFCYGMAEATLLVTAHAFASLDASFTRGPSGLMTANVGAPVDGVELRASAAGNLFVRGPCVFRGYLDGPALEGGWHDTGDVGFERDGEIFISGRSKDMVIVNGENLFPSDIEEIVARVDGVNESLVMSDDDAASGRFYVLVVPKNGCAPDTREISARIGAEFGAVPAAISFGPARSILRTTSGKPMRGATLDDLRQRGALP